MNGIHKAVPMKIVLKIGVRDLVEQLFRTGDLSFDLFAPNRAVDGIRAHQHIQMNRSGDYQAEVTVNYRHETDSYCLQIGGRIDGVLRQGDHVIVEEIKSTSQKVDQLIEDHNPVHWQQLKIYAHIYTTIHKLPEIIGQLTYVHSQNWRQRSFQRTFSAVELKSFFTDTIERYLTWADHQVAWQSIRTESIEALTFPFAGYRPGQRKMAVAVFRALRDRRKLFIQAPTGIGKTMATIFPAVKLLGQGHTGTLFYLTARTTGRIAAENVFGLLRKDNLRFKTLTLTAKDKICFNPQDDCAPEGCHYAKGYYDRRNDAIWHGLSFDCLDRERIEALATQYSVCPFELSLDISKWMDAIICDYNYAFDPRVYLRRHFNEASGEHLLLVDEAHNLAERSREMFSAHIARQPLWEVGRMIKTELTELYECITQINRWFIGAAKSAPQGLTQWSHELPPSDLIPLLTQFVRQAENWLRLNLRSSFRSNLLEQYFAVMTFLRVMESFDESYAVCHTKVKRDLILKLFCIDPSRQLSTTYQRTAAIIFFSATLTPVHYFQSLFGCSLQTDSLLLDSPFPQENVAIFKIDHISTYYRDRDSTCKALCDLLVTFSQGRKGNYLLFFPSYHYLKQVQDLFETAQTEANIIAQTPLMGESERALFLSRFQTDNSKTLVAFAVLGGIFGEGIDLVGDRLCGVAVVGVGLPGICIEREHIRRYYDQDNALGFEFAYQFPGINRVLQAAGRLIRTEHDRGVILLIDPRFSIPQYASLLPGYWQPIHGCKAYRLRARLMGFWQAD